jgi:hypothetical protein
MKNINIPFQMDGGKKIVMKKVELNIKNNSSIFNFIKKLFIKNIKNKNNKLSYIKGSTTKEYYKKLKLK